MGMSDWMRIGAFLLDSSVFLTEKLSPPPKIPNEDTVEKMLQSSGCCVLDNVKSGIWIAGTSNKSFKKQRILCSKFITTINLCFISGLMFSDLQLVRCPVCELNTCDGEQEKKNINTDKSTMYQFPCWFIWFIRLVPKGYY